MPMLGLMSMVSPFGFLPSVWYLKRKSTLIVNLARFSCRLRSKRNVVSAALGTIFLGRLLFESAGLWSLFLLFPSLIRSMTVVEEEAIEISEAPVCRDVPDTDGEVTGVSSPLASLTVLRKILSWVSRFLVSSEALSVDPACLPSAAAEASRLDICRG